MVSKNRVPNEEEKHFPKESSGSRINFSADLPLAAVEQHSSLDVDKNLDSIHSHARLSLALWQMRSKELLLNTGSTSRKKLRHALASQSRARARLGLCDVRGLRPLFLGKTSSGGAATGANFESVLPGITVAIKPRDEEDEGARTTNTINNERWAKIVVSSSTVCPGAVKQLEQLVISLFDLGVETVVLEAEKYSVVFALLAWFLVGAGIWQRVVRWSWSSCRGLAFMFGRWILVVLK